MSNFQFYINLLETFLVDKITYGWLTNCIVILFLSGTKDDFVASNIFWKYFREWLKICLLEIVVIK